MTTSVSYTSFYAKLTKPSLGRLGWLGFICSVSILLLGLGYWLHSDPVFLATSSPNKTYLIKLKGDKGRAFVLPNEVRVDVFKAGSPFISDVYLHSARDAFDLSFEAGFPDVRWSVDNIVEFYRSQYFEKGADSLLVANKTAKPIKWLRIQSENKFLLFDIQPGTSSTLEIPATRTDSQWIALEGAFYDGKEIKFTSKSFDRRHTQRQRFLYEVSILETGLTIEGQPSNRP